MHLDGVPGPPHARRKAARCISGVLNPPAVAAGVLVFLICRSGGPSDNRGALLAVSLVFGVVLPIAYVGLLVLRGEVRGFFIPDRSRRFRPMLVGIVSYAIGFGLLRAISAPRDLATLMLCYAVNGALIALLTLRWKVSLHAVGAWGPLAALVFLFGPRALLLLPLAIAVSWARAALRVHTTAEILAGGGVGFGSTWLLFLLAMGDTPVP